MSVSIDNHDRNKALEKQISRENSKSEFIEGFLWSKLHTQHLDFLFFLLPSFLKIPFCCLFCFAVVVVVVDSGGLALNPNTFSICLTQRVLHPKDRNDLFYFNTDSTSLTVFAYLNT